MLILDLCSVTPLILNPPTLGDAFGTPETIIPPNAPSKKDAKKRAMNGSWRSNSTAGSAPESSPSPKPLNQDNGRQLAPSPVYRRDSFGEQTSEDDSQRIYLPEYCVFVAK